MGVLFLAIWWRWDFGDGIMQTFNRRNENCFINSDACVTVILIREEKPSSYSVIKRSPRYLGKCTECPRIRAPGRGMRTHAGKPALGSLNLEAKEQITSPLPVDPPSTHADISHIPIDRALQLLTWPPQHHKNVRSLAHHLL